MTDKQHKELMDKLFWMNMWLFWIFVALVNISVKI